MAAKNPPCSVFLLAAAAAAILFPSALLSAVALEQIPAWFLASVSRGEWALLHPSIGISAMHMQLLRDNTVVAFDRTDFGRSNLSLPAGMCRHDPSDLALPDDCTAHSVLYDVAANALRPLFIRSDTWCSSGAVDPNGTLVQTGGFNDGDRVVRTFSPCAGHGGDWTELPNTAALASRRWYASNQVLPDGRIIILGGRNAFSYEFLPKSSPGEAEFHLRFLKETTDFPEENNLYPFLHLLPDGNLFIFANRRSISFDYRRRVVVREFPKIPGFDKRNYPSTGSSVLLPLRLTSGGGGLPTRLPDAEVMVCGGAPAGSFLKATRGVYVAASRTCGRIRVSDWEPSWTMETMPMPRVISDMLLLPTGDVMLVNGAMNGTGGWENAANPARSPVLYVPDEPDRARRFVVLKPSHVPRMYHSTAALLADGRILVGGSNPHKVYNFTARPFPTDLSLEAFSPYYLAPEYGRFRPTIRSLKAGPGGAVSYGQVFSVVFSMPIFTGKGMIYVTAVAPSFTTHSFAMNQRVVVVEVVGQEALPPFGHKVKLRAPPSPEIAPPGYYMLFVVHARIPSPGVWLKLLQ